MKMNGTNVTFFIVADNFFNLQIVAVSEKGIGEKHDCEKDTTAHYWH